MKEIKKYIKENIKDYFIKHLIYKFIEFEDENIKIKDINQKSIQTYYGIYKYKMGFLPLPEDEFIKLFKEICNYCYFNYEEITIKEIKKDLKN